MISIITNYEGETALMDQIDSITMNLTEADEEHYEYIVMGVTRDVLSEEGQAFISSSLANGLPIKMIEDEFSKYSESIHKDSTIVLSLMGNTMVRTPDFLEVIYQIYEEMGEVILYPRIVSGNDTSIIDQREVKSIVVSGMHVRLSTHDATGYIFTAPVSRLNNTCESWALYNGLILESVDYVDPTI